MEPGAGIATVSHAIELSLTPVFLLLGIGSFLNVMTSRLARIVDRARSVELHLPENPPDELRQSHASLATLSRRAKLINRAITFCTITALLICVLVAAVFAGAFLDFNASVVIAILFVSAMLTFFVALLLFLREIFLATAALRIGPR